VVLIKVQLVAGYSVSSIELTFHIIKCVESNKAAINLLAGWLVGEAK